MKLTLALISFVLLAAQNLRAGAFDELSGGFGVSAPAPVAAPAASAAQQVGDREAVQWLPPNNDEPGFDWPGRNKEEVSPYIFTAEGVVTLKLAPGDTGGCQLAPETRYELAAAPQFKGANWVVKLAAAPAGCTYAAGYVDMPQISSSSAGGIWELPVNVRAFLDTLGYSEGTGGYYHYIYTYATFEDYSKHPNIKKCSGGLCSTAAGRYQFLNKTWTPLATELGLTDFTPVSQEKAVMELIRRAGAYKSVANSSNYKSFSAAVTKLNGIWASLPGSPYGQPTHSMAKLWAFYKEALKRHK